MHELNRPCSGCYYRCEFREFWSYTSAEKTTGFGELGIELLSWSSVNILFVKMELDTKNPKKQQCKDIRTE